MSNILTNINANTLSPTRMQATRVASLRNPSINLNALNLHSVRRCYIPSNANGHNKLFNSKVKVILSPLKSPVIRKYQIDNKINNHIRDTTSGGLYPKVGKCDSRKCICCTHLQTNSTIKSTVNNRSFNIILPKDVTCKSSHLIYVLT